MCRDSQVSTSSMATGEDVAVVWQGSRCVSLDGSQTFYGYGNLSGMATHRGSSKPSVVVVNKVVYQLREVWQRGKNVSAKVNFKHICESGMATYRVGEGSTAMSLVCVVWQYVRCGNSMATSVCQAV